MEKLKTTTIALADDHILLRGALATLVNSFDNCRVITQANTGKELIGEIESGIVPDIVLLDLNMPDMNGYDTARWLLDHHPEIHILMLTMYDTEQTLLRLLNLGVKGFLRKDVHPGELKQAIDSVIHSGFYYSHNSTGKLLNLFRKDGMNNFQLRHTLLHDTEIVFMKMICSEMTYKEIAARMKLNPRSIDNLRDNLFTKLDVKSRVGLVMYAIRHGIYL